MTTPLLAVFGVGGYEIIVIGMGLAWMAFWVWIYLRPSKDRRD
jgi:hypothetical protein